MEIIKTKTFDDWLKALRDKDAKARIVSRLKNVANGTLGDHKRLGEIYEFRIDYGAGYRIYFLKHRQFIKDLRKTPPFRAGM